MHNKSPLVSVLMPAFNVSATIRRALASLIAQSYEHWECVLIDDGSTDGTADIVASIRDPRIRFSSLGRNYGRGIARQRSLEGARGKYVTMLDADDWLYPDKLKKQVEFLEERPDVTLHSMGMAITNQGRIVSIRRPSRRLERRLDSLRSVFIPHAPSMLRRADIGKVRYDPRFRVAQDQDFLRRVLVGKRYVVTPEVGYSYSEMQSVTIEKIIRGYFYNSQGYLKLVREFGFLAVAQSAVEISKIPYSALVLILRGRDHLLRSRSFTPEERDVTEFYKAADAVSEILRQMPRER